MAGLLRFYSTATNLVAPGASGNIFVRDTCLGAADCMPQTLAVDLAPDGSAPTVRLRTRLASAAMDVLSRLPRAPTIWSSVFPEQVRCNRMSTSVISAPARCPRGCVPHTELVSATREPDAATASPSISSDGSLVAFVSAAPISVQENLPPPAKFMCATPALARLLAAPVFPQRLKQQVNLLETRFAGPIMSADGRYVVIEAGEPRSGYGSQIIMRDTCLGTDAPVSCVPSFARISESEDGSPLAGVNQSASVSADGRFVAFESASSGVIWLRDTCLGASAPNPCVPSTTLVAERAVRPYISPSGRYISFAQTSGPDLALLDVYDTCFGATAPCEPRSYPVNAVSAGSTASTLTLDGSSSAPLSSDGTFIVFSASFPVAGLPLSGSREVLLTITPF